MKEVKELRRDPEVIEAAMEFCIANTVCDGCPGFVSGDVGTCFTELMRDALDCIRVYKKLFSESCVRVAKLKQGSDEPLYPNPVKEMFESGHNSCDLCGKSQAFYYGCEDCGTVFCEDCQKEFYKCPVCGSEHLA